MPTRSIPSLRALLGCAAALLVLVLPGCGGSDDPAEMLRTAFETPVESANVNVTANVRLQGPSPQAQVPYSLRLTGPFVKNEPTQLPSLDWNITAAQGPGNFSARVVTVPDNAFVVLQNQAYEVGRDQVRQALERGRQQGGGNIQQVGVNPATWIANPQERGEQDVAGEGTTHIAGQLDLGRLLRDANRVQQEQARRGINPAGTQPIPEQQINQIVQSVQRPTMDVFVAGDDTVRRVVLNAPFTVPPPQQAAGVNGGTLNITTELSDVGGDQAVNPPPNPQPIQALLQQFGPLLGGGGGAAPPGGGGQAPQGPRGR